MSTGPIIPPEIVDSIIEQISDDKKALMKCSLVCKSWVPACRYRLFSRLVLDPENWNFLRNSDILNVYARAVQLACYHPPLNAGALDDLEAILQPFFGFFLIKLPRLLVRCPSV